MDGPTNNLVTPLLNDLYQYTMTYAYWKNGRADEPAVFDLFFRKNPFKGEYTIFAGLDEVLKFLAVYKLTASDVHYLKTIMPHATEPEFWEYLIDLDCSKVRIYAMQQGEVVFPREPLLRIEGPLAIAQLLETTLLNLVNFPSLIATNAMRMKIATQMPNANRPAGSGPHLPIDMLEFGLRRAQGPDGACSASKYSFIGGFGGTSNVIAGKIHPEIAVRGTHAHAFVMSFRRLEDLRVTTIANKDGQTVEFLSLVLAKRKALGYENTDLGELLAFISYAQSTPGGLVALVDTYDTLRSGIPNFLCVGLALRDLGYKPVGIRLDSGDLAELSKSVRKMFIEADELLGEEFFRTCRILASNDLNEELILALNKAGHEIDTFAVGTNLVTCQRQPALGCVYKLVELCGEPRIKLSQDAVKVTIPSKKRIYRLIGEDDKPVLDLLTCDGEEPPQPAKRIVCRDPYKHGQRAYVTPAKVVPLMNLVWDGGLVAGSAPSLVGSQQLCRSSMAALREQHSRPENPTPYLVALSEELYQFMDDLISTQSPIPELK